MTIFNSVYAHALPFLEKKRYAGLSAALRSGKSLEKESLDKNLDLQWSKVKATLQYAYENVPFYQRRFQRTGIAVADIKSPQDMTRIPVLTREDIRENFDDLWSRRFARESLLEAATGGTTDTPVPILRNPECIPARTAIQMQFNSWTGLLPGDKVFWLWGARSDFATDPSWKWRIFDRYFMRRQWAPTSLLNEAILADYAARLDSFRPTGIMAYPAPLTAFCEYLLQSGYRGHLPKAAICTAEPLLQEQRTIIDKALQCRVFEHYGTRDFGLVAGECERHDGLHVHPSSIFVETLALSADSDLRELIITDLLNPGFPLIRYRINDCVHSLDPRCSCGRGFPRISNIEGRVTDNFYLANGDVVPGVAFTNRIIKAASGIKKLQVIQQTATLFTVNFVPDVDYAETSTVNLKAKLHEFLGSEIRVEFNQVAEIAREKSGKTRLCISNIKPSKLAVPLSELQ